ncbi:L-threonylcarbamoyladenylate synthase [Cohnella boryungensis]|uniref:Threonylcarbamoyl-AMP synthase n=1 Tax=Cohnella boryungensis TaxID=768479 RepID=A0ABV8S9C5_9BACL
MRCDTKYWPAEQARTQIEEAAAALAAGGVVAFPTETVYGLGGDARSTEAVQRIFAAKGRPSDNPLIVHLARSEDIGALAREVNDVESALMKAFWPGPLTLVVPVREGAVSPLVTAGLDTVAVRVPGHELARELIERSGCPIAAPSANRSGRPSPTCAAHVREDLDGRIDGVLDGGATGVGLESTVVRVRGREIFILRPGGITEEQLRRAVKEIGASVAQSESSEATEASAGTEATGGADAPRSPGVKYTHYAPRGEMVLVTGEAAPMLSAVQELIRDASLAGKRVAVLACSEHAAFYRATAVFDCGPRSEPESAARSLYAMLRRCDELDMAYIVAEGYPEAGIGAALMNRLRKAAGGREMIARG